MFRSTLDIAQVTQTLQASHATTWLNLGTSLRKLGQLDEVSNAYIKVLKIDSCSAAHHQFRVRALDLIFTSPAELIGKLPPAGSGTFTEITNHTTHVTAVVVGPAALVSGANLVCANSFLT